MNEYPRDEFDDVSEHTRREGAHRSFVQLRDPRTGLWAIIVCGILALIVGVLMFTVVKPWATSALSTASEAADAAGSAPASSGAAAPSSTTAAATSAQASTAAPKSTTTPSQVPSTSAPASETTAASTTAPSTTSPSTSGSAADLGTSVGVYNATAVSGLAQKSAATLGSGGYTTVRTNNWGKKASVSTVYYKTSAQRATAEAIAAKLGISSVLQVSNIPAPVSVVLGADQLTR